MRAQTTYDRSGNPPTPSFRDNWMGIDPRIGDNDNLGFNALTNKRHQRLFNALSPLPKYTPSPPCEVSCGGDMLLVRCVLSK